ncbi:class I SAM-dependent methyltransferase [Candidatus Pelagibacter sp.]|nr:class I SAM-dependent methyltransferase [Candidatus Pelagibacter sp.]
MKRNLNIDYKKYSLNQYKKTYDSTTELIKFIAKYINLDKKNIIDLACGGGANTIFLAKKFRKSNFLGADLSKDLIKIAKKKLKEFPEINNCDFTIKNWINIHREKDKFDGIISFQSLSYASYPYEKLLKNLKKKNFNFLAFSSLFYNGKCEYNIYIDDFSKMAKKGTSLYTVISTYKIKKILKKNGYRNFKYIPFKINIDLKKPKHSGMQSYTLKLKNNKRIIFSGGLHIPYGFILAY